MNKGDLRHEFTVHVMLPREISAEADHLVERSRHSDWDWKDPQDRHITMAKMGFLNEAQLSKAQDLLARVAAGHSAFQMSFDSPLSFDKTYMPPPAGKQKRGKRNTRREHSHPFVLWLRPDPRGWTRLNGLFKAMAGVLGRHGYSYGYAPSNYQAHSTLARAANDQYEAVQGYIDRHRHWHSKDFKVSAFELREVLAKDDPAHPDQNNGGGSRFRTIATYALKPS